MKLYELFRDLSTGELSNLYVSDEGSGNLFGEAKERVILYANECLTKLYSRFVLDFKGLELKVVKSLNRYPLDQKYAESAWDPQEVDFPYIMDMGREDFLGDVLKVLSIKDSKGREVPLNDENNKYSFFTPQYNVIVVPPDTSGTYDVWYQAKHPKLSINDPEDVEINLPFVLEGALRAYVAHKIYAGMNTQESVGLSQIHANQFVEICAEAVDRDLVNSSIVGSNTSFEARGWV